MHISAPAIICALLPHGEHGVVGRFLTRDDGLQAGYVRGGRGRRLRAVLQPGNEVMLELRARTDSQLAAATLEAGRVRSGVTSSGIGLAAIEWLTGLTAAALPEGDPHPRLYDALDALLDGITAGLPATALGEGVVRFELLMMQELGFGLDLSCCAATGTVDDLAYVSPRSSQAVSREAGAPWTARLLPLPAFLTGGAATPAGVADGLRLTAFFLERDLLAGRKRDVLAAQALFAARLAAGSERYGTPG